MKLSEIQKPTLLVIKEIVKRNINNISKKAEANNLIFRPHFKTHQSNVIAKLFEEIGITKITVSSIDMACQFIDFGYTDIYIAFPLNPREIERINKIPQKIKLYLCIESEDVLCTLDEKITRTANIMIKIDAGYGRTGIPVNNHKKILNLSIKIIESKNLYFNGLLIHNGHTYHAKNKEEIINIHNESLKKLIRLREYPTLKNSIISIGDTPSTCLANNFSGVDEIRPGNFVYFDLMQQNAGVCSTNDIAAFMLAPIVSKHTTRHEIVIHGGAIHFSKEYIIIDGKRVYGKVVGISNGESFNPIHESIYISSLSQEHGIISASKDFISIVKPGDMLKIIPIHSCLTANLMKDCTVYD
jgi:D-serine deaminase-like pyridoxal phosphate-dependent protein